MYQCDHCGLVFDYSHQAEHAAIYGCPQCNHHTINVTPEHPYYDEESDGDSFFDTGYDPLPY